MCEAVLGEFPDINNSKAAPALFPGLVFVRAENCKVDFLPCPMLHHDIEMSLNSFFWDGCWGKGGGCIRKKKQMVNLLHMLLLRNC